MTRRANPGAMRTAAARLWAGGRGAQTAVRARAATRPRSAIGAALLALFAVLLLAPPAQGQRGGGREPGPRYARPAGRPNGQNQGRANGQFQGPKQGQQRGFQGQNPSYRQQPPMGGYGRGETYGRPPQSDGTPHDNYGRDGQAFPRPNYPGAEQNDGRQGPNYGAQDRPYAQPGYGRPNAGYPGAANVRPALPGNRPYAYPGASPPGHLGSWLNQHRNVPLQGQEQLLRNDPSFRQLPQGDQQRLMRQLQQVNRMPAQERERRLARAEMIERMSPQQRMQLNQSSRQLTELPADRQALVKHAFQDLRSVPLDQRQTVLQSQRYQGMFSPQERDILGNLLRAEPYEPAR